MPHDPLVVPVLRSKDTDRRRSLEDRLVSCFNSCRFAVTERILLRVARRRYAHLYTDADEQPLVSVCVPTYNRGPVLIERAVTSVLSQTHKNLELIVVGDHCTDNTAVLLSQIDDPRLRFYNLPRRIRDYPQTVENRWFVGGAVPANKALELARGKWIARVDDDDIWTPDHLKALLHFAQGGNYEFVSAQYVEERLGKRAVIDGVRANDPYYTRRAAKREDHSPKIGGVSTWLYRSYLRFLKYNVDCWRKSWNRVWDADLSVRIFQAGVRMGFLERAVSYVLPRPGETTVGLDAYRQNAAKILSGD
jgi:glycosyltransferase involved in cell wall biosynthesis